VSKLDFVTKLSMSEVYYHVSLLLFLSFIFRLTRIITSLKATTTTATITTSLTLRFQQKYWADSMQP